MIKLIKELFSLLTPGQRRRFYVLQILVVLMAIFELVGIASIAPFMAIVSDPAVIESNHFLNQLYFLTGFTEYSEFLFFIGVLVLSTLILAAFVSMFTIWRLSLFGTKVGTEIADRLYAHYLHQDWLFHASGSSAQLTKQVATEAVRVTEGVIQPLVQMNAKIILSIMISAAIILYNPIVALTGLVIFAIAYVLLFKIVRKKLQKNGSLISSVMTHRYRLMNEGFGGIKDVLLLGRNSDFINRFEKSGQTFALARGSNLAISQVPRYLIELIAFGSIIGLVLSLLTFNSQDISVVLPILSVYALAGFKLLPALQQIYSSLSLVKGNISSFESIREDLQASQKQYESTNKLICNSTPQERLSVNQRISLEKVTFTYPGKHRPAVDALTLDIAANSIVGVVGPSGSGKSTVIDILLGLIDPQKGLLLVDDVPITKENRRAWQNIIGFVPQSIFLSEGSIAENVAFGIPEKEIDLKQVGEALKLAHLDELVQTLENGVHTKVGERGVQLSGGQRQRIGIARALYHEADVLVFDEATSALDGITEKMIMDAIHDFGGRKTIIMIAHRLKTVQKCDQIYMIEQGKVSAQGSYEQLLNSNELFKKMASHA
ncbi:ABC transporter ATP-binding protein [Thiomicrorhabdus sp. 6S3-12]|uniref:ABC transporter ATP-binding protein n=1 Tax=Thiomicrorhabdus sp. 6S3-12 TaxID=2819681 RepID=UPI001AADC8D9|nr:ABC transporter ATP-binding protein [Thiomicrorhabdus sp. 6S3-12]MBO1922996.1 ABC transporter ATP-binding protein [Thiomicrorhabdus sp. 6S3-12]